MKFAIKNCVDPTSQTSKSSSESLIHATFRHFTRVFTHFCDPDSLRISQSLYQAHIHHSLVSPISIGPLYLQHPHPTSLSKNFFKIFLWHSQSLYKTHIHQTLVSSSPIGSLYIQHVNPRDNRLNFLQKRQDLHFICVFHMFQKKHPNVATLTGCRFTPQTK